MAERDSAQPDIIADRVELRPALSSTGDVPVFLQQNPPDPAPEEPVVPPEGEPAPPAEPDEAPDDTPPADPPTEVPEPPPAEAKPDPRTVRAREQDARIARLETMLAQSIEALTAAQTKAAEPPTKAPELPPTPAPDPRPTRAQFDDPDAYDAALVEWAASSATRKALEAHQAQLAEQAAAAKAVEDRAAADRAATEQAQLVWNAHQDRRAKFIATHPDYESVVERQGIFLPSNPGTMPLCEAIKRATDGPAIAYYIAQNPAEEARITSMTDPWAVLLEVGKISAQLSRPKAPEVSRTPKPIEPVSGNAMAAGKDVTAMTTEEYARHTGRDKPQYKPFLASSGRTH